MSFFGCSFNIGGLFRDDVDDVLMNQTVSTPRVVHLSCG